MKTQDFTTIAEALDDALNLCIQNPEPKRPKEDTVKQIILHLADKFDNNYSNFERGKFLHESGYNAVNINNYPL